MGGAWPGEAEAEKGEIGGDEVGSLSWAEGGEEDRGEMVAGQGTQDPTPPSPGFQGPCPPGDAPIELSVGSGSATAGAMSSALAGAGPAVPGRSKVAPGHASEAVRTPPRTGAVLAAPTVDLLFPGNP